MAPSVLIRTAGKMALIRDTLRNTAASSSLTEERAVRILAKSMFKELRAQGYTERQIVQLAGELLANLNAEKRGR